MAAACTSFPPAVVSNASSPASATSRVWSPDGTRILFKRSVVLPDLPTIEVVGLDGKPPRPVRPDVLGQFRRFTRPGIRTAGAYPSGGRPARGSSRFLTVPLEDGSGTTSAGSRRSVRQDLALVSTGRFVWARIAPIHLFRGTRRRYPERLAHYRRSADRRLGRWPRTPDDWCGTGDERRHLAGRDEADLHDDVEQNEALVVPVRPSQRARHG